MKWKPNTAPNYHQSFLDFTRQNDKAGFINTQDIILWFKITRYTALGLTSILKVWDK